ncbi:hypothetical protein FJR48_01625 [Sulfurimonas lithotrophica]|uniref:Uncharacterized protein n=1 Tax=Sulfurimonas lithotrophica TaxID=2590022 RepID=A0A5P8NYI2_9BACT|nr:hypothetical protein [Sulfurimonas lithotrophica]QFR48493.1 hypothetical protein FJR48_01625 [Sulfurimonas lithotrophica]
MSLSIILFAAFILSIIFHFIGVYANAKKIVWIMIILMWAGGINMAMSEIKPKGYEDIKKIQGQFPDTDALIKEAGEEISIYEMLGIMQSYQKNNPKK